MIQVSFKRLVDDMCCTVLVNSITGDNLDRFFEVDGTVEDILSGCQIRQFRLFFDDFQFFTAIRRTGKFQSIKEFQDDFIGFLALNFG